METEVRRFSGSDNARFWGAYEGSYDGTINARFLVALTRDQLGDRMLDAGGADGSLMRELKRARPGAQVTAVDLAPKSPEVEEGDLTRLRFEDGAFDTVYCTEVIEHTSPETTASILRELVRVLRPGGVLCLTTPHAERLENNTVVCPNCDSSFHRWGHQQSFGIEDFERILREGGLEPMGVFPLKYRRLGRARLLGARLLRSRLGQRYLRGRGSGKRTLVALARKRAGA